MLYKKMADILSPIEVGEAKVVIMDYTNKKLGFWETMSGIRNEKYAKLIVNGELVMSETPMEHRTNSDFVLDANGDVLIGGLGLGMIILAVQDKENVSSITVVERSQDVIDAVANQLPLNNKVKIICNNVFTYKPSNKFDCIYMDIWSYVNEDIYKEMQTLKRRYGHYLKPKKESPKRFNRCWAEWYAKTGRKLI